MYRRTLSIKPQLTVTDAELVIKALRSAATHTEIFPDVDKTILRQLADELSQMLNEAERKQKASA